MTCKEARPLELRLFGPKAHLLMSSDHSWLQSLTRKLDRHPLPHLVEWVLGHDSLLLLFGNETPLRLTEEFLNSHEERGDQPVTPSHLHQINVCYDGPDLKEVSQYTGLSIDEIVRRHSAPIYFVRFLGFAPGFAYLDGLDPKLVLPRRTQPRERMAGGAVAIGGPHTGIYSVPSPGGWNWLGHTDHCLFDPHSEVITLQPGDQVQLCPKPR